MLLGNKEKKETRFGIVLLIIAIIVIIIAIVSTVFAVINIKNTKILKGITIGNIDVSEMTTEEAIKKLDEIYGSKGEKQIYLKYGE